MSLYPYEDDDHLQPWFDDAEDVEDNDYLYYAEPAEPTGVLWLCWLLGCTCTSGFEECRRCGARTFDDDCMPFDAWWRFRSWLQRLVIFKRCLGCRRIIGFGTGSPYWCGRPPCSTEADKDVPF